jgi:hypothetical protein
MMVQTHEQRISLCHIIFFLQELARKLRPSTLRAKFGKTKVQNAVHCTDLPEDGLLEVILSVAMNVRFVVLMAMTVKTIIFWDVMPCTVVDHCLQDGNGMFLRDAGNNPPDNMASHPKRQVSHFLRISVGHFNVNIDGWEEIES